MTPEQAAAFVHAQAVSASIELESMKSANLAREEQGHAHAYGEEEFLEMKRRYTIDHNDVVITFNQANEYAGRT